MYGIFDFFPTHTRLLTFVFRTVLWHAVHNAWMMMIYLGRCARHFPCHFSVFHLFFFCFHFLRLVLFLSLWARASFTMPYPMNWVWDDVIRFIFYPVFGSRLCGRVFHSLLESDEYINSCPHNMRFQSSWVQCRVGELLSRVGSDESFVLCLCSI